MKPSAPLGKLNPTNAPTPVMSRSTKTLRTRSAVVRPASTADRAMGSARNRSMSPFWRSSARPTAVPIPPKATLWMKIPAIRKSM